MTENEAHNKAIVVLTQEEIDTTIHGLEQAGSRMTDDEFRAIYGDVYRKLHAIENKGGDNEYRVR